MKLVIAHIYLQIFSFALAYPSSKPNLRIIGGQTARIGHFPYIVSIQHCFWLLGCSHYCSGSVIAPTWIVTAAQCVQAKASYKVLAGILDLDDSGGYREVIDVNHTVVHFGYGGVDNPVNDIALVQLKTALTYNPLILPIVLPAQNVDTTGDTVFMGWGDITGHGHYPNTLYYINFTIINATECKQELDYFIEPNKVHFDGYLQICTSDDNQGKSICSRDGGGPLVQNGTLVGIASWGVNPCGTVGAPSVYTKVSSYVDWITENMQD